MSLRELRREKKWTQERLAAESGVDQTTISRLETEPNPNPTEATKNALAKALGIAPSKLRFTTPSTDAIGTRDDDRAGHDADRRAREDRRSGRTRGEDNGAGHADRRTLEDRRTA